jgi:hypothetical protein
MLLISSNYLASIELYRQINAVPHIIIEANDNYLKGTARNRCAIATENGRLELIIPVKKPEKENCPMKDVRIAPHGRWQQQHWNAIVSAYNSSPFFEHYGDWFRPFYEAPFEFLFDFNELLRQTVCELLPLSPVVEYTTAFAITPDPWVIDMRDAWNKKPPAVEHPVYHQVFESRHGFIQGLSIIDLLFNTGPEAVVYLR